MNRQDDLLKERARLERLIGTSNTEAWKAIEKIAQAQKRICEHTVMVMNHGNFEQEALDAAGIRGEHKVWTWLGAIRGDAPLYVAKIETELAALRKEGPDGLDLRQAGKGEGNA